MTHDEAKGFRIPSGPRTRAQPAPRPEEKRPERQQRLRPRQERPAAPQRQISPPYFELPPVQRPPVQRAPVQQRRPVQRHRVAPVNPPRRQRPQYESSPPLRQVFPAVPVRQQGW